VRQLRFKPMDLRYGNRANPLGRPAFVILHSKYSFKLQKDESKQQLKLYNEVATCIDARGKLLYRGTWLSVIKLTASGRPQVLDKN
jgi:hypothetical protein